MLCTDASAFEAAAALDGYEARLNFLSRGRAHPADLARADTEIRKLCTACAALPQLSVACVTLLLSHYRLLAELARRAEAGERDAPRLQLQSHAESVTRLRRQCRNLLLAAHLH